MPITSVRVVRSWTRSPRRYRDGHRGAGARARCAGAPTTARRTRCNPAIARAVDVDRHRATPRSATVEQRVRAARRVGMASSTGIDGRQRRDDAADDTGREAPHRERRRRAAPRAGSREARRAASSRTPGGAPARHRPARPTVTAERLARPTPDRGAAPRTAAPSSAIPRLARAREQEARPSAGGTGRRAAARSRRATSARSACGGPPEVAGEQRRSPPSRSRAAPTAPSGSSCRTPRAPRAPRPADRAARAAAAAARTSASTNATFPPDTAMRCVSPAARNCSVDALGERHGCRRGGTRRAARGRGSRTSVPGEHRARVRGSRRAVSGDTGPVAPRTTSVDVRTSPTACCHSHARRSPRAARASREQRRARRPRAAEPRGRIARRRCDDPPAAASSHARRLRPTPASPGAGARGPSRRRPDRRRVSRDDDVGPGARSPLRSGECSSPSSARCMHCGCRAGRTRRSPGRPGATGPRTAIAARARDEPADDAPRSRHRRPRASPSRIPRSTASSDSVGATGSAALTR